MFTVRIVLFLLTNVSVMLVFGLLLFTLGIKHNSIEELVLLSGLLGFGGSFISLLLSKWIALKSINGVKIENPKNLKERWLIDVVKNHAKIVGIKTPEIYIYDSPSMNAFATGPRKNSSLVAVSNSLLSNMNDNEVEAVIAHEISHISNGDMVAMTLIQGAVNTVMVLFSRVITQTLTNIIFSNKEKEDVINLSRSITYFFISMLSQLLFGFLATIITMWYSRKREFYADAGAAKIVGIENMVSALKRLKMDRESKKNTSFLATLCINGKSSMYFKKLFMSHPTISKRIEALYNKEYL